MSDRCDHCGQVHPTNAAVAIGRFDPRGPSGWRPAPPKCSVDGCPGDARSLGMCPAHYARMHRHGTTDLKVRPEVTHCRQGHEWTPENTAKTPDGYRACRQCQRDRAATYKARLRAGKVVVRAEKVPCSANITSGALQVRPSSVLTCLFTIEVYCMLSLPGWRPC